MQPFIGIDQGNSNDSNNWCNTCVHQKRQTDSTPVYYYGVQMARNGSGAAAIP